MEIPEPTKCPLCRQQQRLPFRNEINLFKRKCDKTGKEILSMYEPGSPFKVYDHEEWWKDDWDPMTFGRDFDFNKPFFEQFMELMLVVPRMSLNTMKNENSYYTNYAVGNKNSYLVTTADYNEGCMYGRFSDRNFRCMDFDFTYDAKVSYQTLNCHMIQNCFYSQKLDGCSENYFCYDMRGCHNCIFCADLRNQSYMVFNKKVSAEEFAEAKKQLSLGSRKGVLDSIKKAEEFLKTQPRKYLETIQCDECIGDYLKNSKNARFCFDGYDLHDVKYCSQVFKLKDSYDWDFVGDQSECCYQMVSSAGKNMFCKFCMNTWDGNTNMYYCDLCLYNNNCFGCIGLRHAEYCILNKKYSKDEYETLKNRIIEHMKKTSSTLQQVQGRLEQSRKATGSGQAGEFGEFFPASMSPFAYNDSVAQEQFPLTKEEVEAQGLRWRDEDKKEYAPQTYNVPDEIADVPDSITEKVLACESCKKNFKIVPQEIKFYREFNLAVPNQCWICRHKARMALKNPRVINQRNCSKCGTQIFTTYAPERPEPIYCEKCYLDFVA
jgi:Zn ribbon nucleic-acid-binding protein